MCTGAIMEYTIGSEAGNAGTEKKHMMYADETHMGLLRNADQELFVKNASAGAFFLSVCYS